MVNVHIYLHIFVLALTWSKVQTEIVILKLQIIKFASIFLFILECVCFIIFAKRFRSNRLQLLYVEMCFQWSM